jgi:hypothetical integral membrane protein (TIGR02206 family)
MRFLSDSPNALLASAPDRFVAFDGAHLGALACVALVAYTLVRVVRARPRASPFVRGGLVAAIVALAAFEFGVGAQEGWLTWRTFLPLELCDAALVLAVIALVRPSRTLAQVVYFWSGSGTLLAIVTPDLPWAFPRWEFVVFFGLHGLVIVAAMVLVFGMGLTPPPGAAWRMLAITAGWAGFVGLVNLALGTNYMYLRRKPEAATPLDWMGPWPVYIATSALLALALFQLLALPFRRNLYS